MTVIARYLYRYARNIFVPNNQCGLFLNSLAGASHLAEVTQAEHEIAHIHAAETLTVSHVVRVVAAVLAIVPTLERFVVLLGTTRQIAGRESADRNC